MDTTRWVESKAGTYVRSVFNDEHISKAIWQACYIPYLAKYIGRPSHIFYHAPYQLDIRDHLIESGAHEEQVITLTLTHHYHDGEFRATNVPLHVALYPPSHVVARSSSINARIMIFLPDGIDKFALRCFDDTDDDKRNERHAKIPSWRGHEPIVWH